ncbi:SH3 domain-containing protein [Sagittula sp. S175]|uniref:SH3 domain-containing protein n=1 Tax=Sagittula sp. S175 TaxID=3415129 RepID=UPI003C7C536E
MTRLFLVLLLVPLPALAEDLPVAFRYCVEGVRTDLNMRAGPGTQHGPLGAIPAQACDVEGVRWRTRDWVLVSWQGTLGWVALRYLRPVE